MPGLEIAAQELVYGITELAELTVGFLAEFAQPEVGFAELPVGFFVEFPEPEVGFAELPVGLLAEFAEARIGLLGVPSERHCHVHQVADHSLGLSLPLLEQ